MRDYLAKLYRRVKENKLRAFLFLVGIAILAFPIVSQVSYYIASHQNINQFEKSVAKIDTSEIDRRIALAKAYNEAISRSPLIVDPFTKEQEEGVKEYARMLEVNEQIGHVSIPTIGVDIPVYAGTTEAVLEKGSGHLEGTSLPVGGPSTHTVLTAHRGLPTARLFTDLNKVKKGDTFFITNIKETLAYRVEDIKVVEPTDLGAVKVVDGKDYATLLTCTPYMINSHRLLVRGRLVPYAPNKIMKHQKEAKAKYRNALIVKVILISIASLLFAILIKKIIKRKKGQR